MAKRFFAAAASAALVFAGLNLPAPAAVIDTFDFSIPVVVPGFGPFSGSFTGTVEPGGLIEQNDLSAFAVSQAGVQKAFLSGLALFSFDIDVGASSLDVIAYAFFAPPFEFCVGAASVLSRFCETEVGTPNPPGTTSVVFPNGTAIADTSSDPITVVLVSSVNTAVPEPSTWGMMVIGFAGLGFAGYRRATRRPDPRVRPQS